MSEVTIEIDEYEGMQVIKEVVKYGDNLEKSAVVSVRYVSNCPSCGRRGETQFGSGPGLGHEEEYFQRVPYFVCYECQLHFDWGKKRIVTSEGIPYQEYVKELEEGLSAKLEWTRARYRGLVAGVEKHVIENMIRHGAKMLEFTFSDKDKENNRMVEVMSYCLGYIYGYQDRPMEWEE